MTFESISQANYDAVSRIYMEGIQTGHATFETAVPEWHAWDQDHLPFGRFLLKDGLTYLGFAALSPVSGRCVYGGVAEVSVYVSANSRGRGVGSRLLQKLIEESERHGLWTLQAGIFPNNEASINLHLKHGFRKIGFRERIGRLHGQWHDNVILERRSQIVGV